MRSPVDLPSGGRLEPEEEADITWIVTWVSELAVRHMGGSPDAREAGW